MAVPVERQRFRTSFSRGGVLKVDVTPGKLHHSGGGSIMILRMGLAMVVALASVTAQTATESNLAYRRFQDLQSTPEGVTAAEHWLQIYKPNSTNVPPYLTVARFYAARGAHMNEIPALLAKGSEELTTPGGYTDLRAKSNSPFRDDLDRTQIANVYTQIRQYDRAHVLLEAVNQTIGRTNPEALGFARAKIFQALLFCYRDAAVRLAVAEGRREDALAIEHDILTVPRNVVAPRMVEENRTVALQLWKDLGRSEDEFQAWLASGR